MSTDKPETTEDGKLSQASSRDDKPNGSISKMAEQKPEAAAKKPGLLKKAWTKTGLDPLTIILMAKG